VADPDILDIQRFPLEHTNVRAEIIGNVARVEVTQKFHNPYDIKIEAVYVFPLPNRAAVNDMEIHVGERTIKGIIKKREEARRIYEEAKRAGHVAALLDQERPNIFTQSVANILPGNRIEVKICYFEALPYVDNDYTFAFPMVVGPRFIPGTATGSGKRGWSPDTTDVPDASRITPPVLEPGQRSGHDISLEVKLDAGTELVNLASPSHEVEVDREGKGAARIVLKKHDSIPNKDFVLRYRLDADAPQLVFLPHRKEDDGYFMLLIQPEASPAPDTIAPKEMVFVVDCSGSMSGFPLEKVKEAMRHSLTNLNPNDTFQIVRFSNSAETFAPAPVSATEGNIQRGLGYIETLAGRGGTIMLEGVRAALTPPKDPERVRIVSFMTDGYIGNENQILAYMEGNLNGARLFSFGVGSSVNRYLLDKMAEFGRGAVEYVLLQDDAEEPVKRFYERVRNPYLTDIEIDWGGAEVEGIYPKRIPDLFVGQPVVLHGRYTQPGKATLTLRARLGGKPYEQRVTVRFPAKHEEGEAIGTLWARARIEDLSNQQIVQARPELEEEITQVALEHRLVSAYTSFVAVEEKIVTGSEQPVLVEVPVEMPDGVSYQGVFGGEAGGMAGRNAQLGRGRMKASAPASYAHRTLDAPALTEAELAPMKRPEEPTRELVQEEDQQAALLCRIEAARASYRVGEPVEIVVTLENLTGKTVQVPANLSTADGTARFQILDADWKALAHPTRHAAKPPTIELQPGARVTLHLIVNGAGGYRITTPGTYHIVLLGTGIGLPNSNTLTIRIDP
jgi:Ca-activated chloride channel family protein